MAFGEIINPKADEGSSGREAITHSCFGAGSSIKDGTSNFGNSGLLVRGLGLFGESDATGEKRGSCSGSELGLIV